MILEYILLSLPLVTHFIVDLKGKVIHWLNGAYVLGLSVIVGLVLPGYWWQGFLYALAIHFTFFDYAYNLSHGKKFFYHGDPRNPDRAMFDKLWDKFPYYAEVFARLWVLGVGWSVYYHLDWIKGIY